MSDTPANPAPHSDPDARTLDAPSGVDDAGAPSSAPSPDATTTTRVLRAGRRFTERIGRYRVIGLLGEGGMGAVYLAEQDKPKRLVALKVIRPGVTNPRLLARFEHEAQILGRLQHPGIAQIYEAGSADTGDGAQPYFVMEYVAGRSLLDYAAARELGTRARLELLARICEAVQHAHLKGIIHRDLKPGNILVTDEGQPKILDFGVARATDLDLQAATMQTDIGQLIGTVPYMSPEQAAGDPNELDTRSDVYALGVIGYELLAGRMPYELSKAMLHEAVRVIREREPTPLSAVNRVFRGDVETIFAKALEKDRSRRYQSAMDFAADIRRSLADEPIVARPASVAYRFSKFARRNRLLVSGLALLVLVLVGGIIGTSAGLLRALTAEGNLIESLADEKQARAQAEEGRKEFERQARIALAVVDFLNHDLLEGVDPERTANRDVTMRELLDAASARIAGRFPGEPVIEAAVRAIIGRTYRSLGRFDEALLHLESAVATQEALLGKENKATLTSRNDLGLTLHELGRNEEALAIFTALADIYQRSVGDDALDTLTIRLNLAGVLRTEGRAAEAEVIQRDVLRRLRATRGESDVETISPMNNLAVTLRALDRTEEAEALLREALALCRATLGDKSPSTATTLNNLALAVQVAGEYDEAAEYFTEALAIQREVLGDDHPSTLSTMANLSTLHWNLGRIEEALPPAEMAARALERALGRSHPDTQLARVNLAALYNDLERYEDAEPLLREALASFTESGGMDHPTTLTVLNNLAFLCDAVDRNDEAERLYRDSLVRQRRALGDDHADTVVTLNNLGKLLLEMNRPEEAEVMLAEAVERAPRAFSADHWTIGLLMEGHARALLSVNRLEEAEREALEGHRIIAAALGDDHDRARRAASTLVSIYEARGDEASAVAWRERAR